MTTDRSRLVLLSVVVLCLATALGARLYDLQVRRCDDLRDRAADQHERHVKVSAMRGSIVDRNGTELAVSLETRALYADPRRVDDATGLARQLAPLIGVSASALREKLGSDRSFVFLDRFCEPETIERLHDAGVEIGGDSALGLLTTSKRYYPHGRLASHVIGVAGVDGDGLDGVELAWDDALSGDPTEYLVVRDAQRARLRELVRPPRNVAHDVVLTIDAVLQHVVERELDRVMRETEAASASAILLDPRTGDVLALANRPTVDLNRYGRTPVDARRNRAVVDPNEPGSTFKVVSMAAALESRAIRGDERFDCEGGSVIHAARVVRDSTPHDMLTVDEIMALSSNIGMIKIGSLVPDAAMFDTIIRLGFGRSTGSGMPGESGGIVRAPTKWTAGSKGTISFGHEVAVTALQMVSAVATIANDGIRVTPGVVRELRRPDGRTIPGRQRPTSRAISASTARRVAGMMELVVREGTGRRAAVDGWRLAGKTGTAQKLVDGVFSDTDYIASFVGFGPVRSPRLVGLVLVDTPKGGRHQGGVVAAPAFRAIMSDAMLHLRVPPDDPARVAALGDGPRAPAMLAPARRSAAAPGRVPDLRGESLREAMALLAEAELRAEVNGNGVVVEQSPRAGEPAPAGSICRVTLRPRCGSDRVVELASWSRSAR